MGKPLGGAAGAPSPQPPPPHRPATRVSGPILRLSGPGARTSSRGDAQPSSDTRPPHPRRQGSPPRGHFLLGTQSPGHTPLPTADPAPGPQEGPARQSRCSEASRSLTQTSNYDSCV